jgi:hypothetical protein
MFFRFVEEYVEKNIIDKRTKVMRDINYDPTELLLVFIYLRHSSWVSQYIDLPA